MVHLQVTDNPEKCFGIWDKDLSKYILSFINCLYCILIVLLQQ